MRIYNTLTNQLEEFRAPDDVVRMYVCGVTTYDYMHLGHARTYVIYDVIRRYLQHRGYGVFYVQNITDIDDKIINRAKQEDVDPLVLSRQFADEMFGDMDALGVGRADRYPRVSEHIGDIIEFVEDLIELGYAYEAGGSVYFDVSRDPDYGKLSNQSLDQIRRGARVEPEEEKDDPADFALWKHSDDYPTYPSPWGPGRPGWHIECSAMAMKHLGAPIDIHGGARDLIFPHHENEIAQAESLTGEPFVKYWVHVGLLRVGGRKMSKSLGNFVTVRDVLMRFEPEAIRHFLISASYRSPLDFSYERLEASQRSLDRIHELLDRLRALQEVAEIRGLDEEERALLDQVSASKQDFVAAMDDDFNTAQALAVVYSLVGNVNRWISERKGISRTVISEVLDVFDEFGGILNLFQPREHRGDLVLDDLVDLVLMLRADARRRRDFETADIIRARLSEMGIEVQDTPEGPQWKYARA